jgi:hypothetical protein
MENKMQTVKYVDITPLWSEILPALVMLLDTKEREFAMEELTRMAKLADRQVAMMKADQ